MSEKIEKWVSEYSSNRSLYESFSAKLAELINELLQINNVSYSGIEKRAKTVDSFKEKLQRPGKKYKSPFEELPDIAGVRVILYYDSDIDVVCNLLKKEFYIIENMSIDKKNELGEDKFGYLSVHKIIKLKGKRKKVTEWKRFENIHCEIQVRTVLQHAWAAISHKLQYKREFEVPLEYRRKLIRLSGLLELADEQFSDLRDAQIKASASISDKILKSDLNIPIDSLSIRNYLSSSSVASKINRTAEKTGTIIITDDIYTGDADLIYISNIMQLDTIKNLDEKLKKISLSFAESFFSKYINNVGVEVHNDIGHNLAMVLYARYYKEYNFSLFKWPDYYLDELRNAVK